MTGLDTTDVRRLALAEALRLYRDNWYNLIIEHGTDEADQALRATATTLYDFLVGPVALYITIGTVVHQNTGQPTGTIIGGTPMQLHDDEQVDLTVTVASAKGSPIANQPGTEDDITWTVGDDTVATLGISDDTRTCTVRAGVTGSTVVTVSLRELSATLAMDVIPGDATVLTIGEGAPTKQA